MCVCVCVCINGNIIKRLNLELKRNFFNDRGDKKKKINIFIRKTNLCNFNLPRLKYDIKFFFHDPNKSRKKIISYFS